MTKSKKPIRSSDSDSTNQRNIEKKIAHIKKVSRELNETLSKVAELLEKREKRRGR